MAASPPAKPSGGVAGCTPRRLNSKALDESEQVVLKARQFITSFSMPGVASIGKKALDVIHSSVSKRLTPEMVAAYTAKFQPTDDRPEDDGRAAKLHTDLGELDQKLMSLGALVVSLQATSGAEASAEQLRSAGEACRACGIIVSHHVDRVVLSRALCQAAQAKDFTKCVRLLDVADEKELLSIRGLTHDDAAVIQRRVLVDQVIIFAKVEPDRTIGASCNRVPCALDSLRRLLEAIPLARGKDDEHAPRHILDDELHQQLLKLKAVLFVRCSTDEGGISLAEKARGELMKETSCLFHKVIANFHTGVQARVEADAFFEQVKADAGRAFVLAELGKSLGRLKIPGVEGCIGTSSGIPSTVCCPSAAIWVDMNNKLTVMTTKGSAMFLQKHKTDIASLRALQSNLVAGLVGAAEAIFASSAGRVASAVDSIMRKRLSGSVIKAASFDSAFAKFLVFSEEDMAVAKQVASPGCFADYSQQAAELTTAISVIKASTVWVQQLTAGASDCEFLASPEGAKFLTALHTLRASSPEGGPLAKMCNEFIEEYPALARAAVVRDVVAMEGFQTFAAGLADFAEERGHEDEKTEKTEDITRLDTVFSAMEKINAPGKKQDHHMDDEGGADARPVGKALLALADVLLDYLGNESFKEKPQIGGVAVPWFVVCIAPRFFAGACYLQRLDALDPSRPGADLSVVLFEVEKAWLVPILGIHKSERSMFDLGPFS